MAYIGEEEDFYMTVIQGNNLVNGFAIDNLSSELRPGDTCVLRKWWRIGCNQVLVDQKNYQYEGITAQALHIFITVLVYAVILDQLIGLFRVHRAYLWG